MKLCKADIRLAAGEELLVDAPVHTTFGHGNTGIKNAVSKLNDDRVRHIRNNPMSSLQQLAQIHGVHSQTIFYVRHLKTWRHVKPGPSKEYT